MTSLIDTGVFAASFAALYVGHHVGDYWVQTDHDAKHKGDAGAVGRIACTLHVLSYLATQGFMLLIVTLLAGIEGPAWPLLLGLAVSGVTHYAADRREHGLMFRLARLLPGKAAFLRLGVPRAGVTIETWDDCPDCEGRGVGGPASDESTSGKCWTCRGGGRLPAASVGDNPSLGTGAWALDQSWHLLFGVFVPAIILAWR